MYSTVNRQLLSQRCERRLRRRSLLIAFHLGRQKESKVTQIFDRVFKHDRNIWGHVQIHGLAERRRLCEVDQVIHCELQLNRIVALDSNRDVLLYAESALRRALTAREANLIFINSGALTTCDGSLSNVAVDREREFALRRRDLNRITDGAEVTTDSLELVGRHRDRAGEVRVGHVQVLAVNVHQLQLKVGDAVLVCTQ